jgi:hypothetical protein
MLFTSSFEIPVGLNRLPSALFGHAERIVCVTTTLANRLKLLCLPFGRSQAKGLALLFLPVCNEAPHGIW